MQEIKYNPEVAISRKGMIALYYNTKILQEDINWFKNEGYKLYILEIDKIDSMANFHIYVSKVLGFPSYYGQNMDAFNDSLSELDLKDYKGALIVFHRYDVFMKNFPKQAFTVLEIIADASRLYLLEGIKLMSLVQLDNTELAFPIVGGYRIVLNPREG